MKNRLISAFILIAYSALLVKVMVFKDIPPIRIGVVTLNFGGTNASNPANFIPLKTILPYLFGGKGFIIGGLNLVGNIALLVPIGLLIPFVYRNMTWKKSLALAVLAGLIIEGTQVVLQVGIFDIDDVILNALGLMIGYSAFLVFTTWMHSTKSRILVIAAIVMIAAGVALFAVRDVWQSQPPTRFAPNAGDSRSELTDIKEDKVPESEDLCGGTSGNGKIASIEDDAISMTRKDGSSLTIHLTDRTTIETSTGPASLSDLKIGDSLTLVGDMNPDGTFTAQTLVVCGTTGSEILSR